VFLLFWLLHRWRALRVWLLLLASYLFYMGWSAKFALLIVFQTVSDYYLALALVKLRHEGARKCLVWLSVTINLGILALFKYYDFFLDSFAQLCRSWGWELSPPTLRLVLPVGISFYTFHTLSYVLDVYGRKIRPARNLSEFALAVVFFPQLVAGPIVRAAEFLPQLDRTPTFDLSRIQTGLLQFFCGLFKKVVLADALAATLVDPVFHEPHLAGGGHLLLALYAYAFQIYCDFSGYTDMALGCAQMLGYDLPINFDLPYRATDLRDFWRRWHISLSTFLRDYLYIPLGGSQGGKWRTCRNLMITMLLGGLWHGAAWTFVLWGAYHGALLVVQHVWPRQTNSHRWPQVVRILITFHLVCLGWLFFRAEHFADIGLILERIFTWAPCTETGFFLRERGVWMLLLAAVLHYLPRERLATAGQWLLDLSPLTQGALAAVVLALFGILETQSHPFIYFQF
jgi:alginate O-acetyltransferase complex protein AlgI